MLKIPRKFHLELPHFSLSSPAPLQFSPIVDDDDELTQAVYADIDEHDDNWELSERPDGSALESFWETVEQDITKDPKWFSSRD